MSQRQIPRGHLGNAVKGELGSATSRSPTGHLRAVLGPLLGPGGAGFGWGLVTVAGVVAAGSVAVAAVGGTAPSAGVVAGAVEEEPAAAVVVALAD